MLQADLAVTGITVERDCGESSLLPIDSSCVAARTRLSESLRVPVRIRFSEQSAWFALSRRLPLGCQQIEFAVAFRLLQKANALRLAQEHRNLFSEILVN